MNELCDRSASELVSLIQAGEVSPVEVLNSCLERIRSVNGVLNAIVAIDEKAGQHSARRTEQQLARGEATGLLAGLPVGIKDLEATAGLTTTWGCQKYAQHIPQQDDYIVERIRSADGNVFCKTNTPEFGAGGNTKNRVYGVTGNPFDPQKTCAGSSGGTAVALATGMLPFATGSDYGGSLRTPAAFCGIAGFRPSPGVVPNVHSVTSLSPFPVLGPMGRTVADVHLLLRAMAAFDRRDPYSSGREPIADTLQPADLAKVRAAWSVDLQCCPVDHAVARLFESRLRLFRSGFGQCDERAPGTGHVHDVFETLRGVGFVAAHRELLRNDRELLGPNVIDNTERGLQLSATQIASAYQHQSELYREGLAFFDDVDVLICPAAAVSPFPHTQLSVKEINGESMPTYMRWLALSYVPTTLMCCSFVLPCGLDEAGMPFGIQLVGAPGSDNKILSIAAALEALLAAEPMCRRPLPAIDKLLKG